MLIAIFNTNSYTVQDLMTTGNLKLFSAHKKNAILKYKNSQDNYILIQLKTIDLITTKFEDYEKEIDVLFTNGYANKEHIEVKDWQYDLNSTQFRKRNNYLTTFFELYKYQITAMEKLRKETIELRNLLGKK